jgi:choline-sulfatase
MRLAALFALVISCAGQTPVVIISVDTLRADHNRTTFDTVFTAAASQVPLTLPSHTVLLTSTYPHETRVESNAGTVPRGTVTLASVLQAKGYKTAAFIGSVFLERQLGLDQGFETYDSPFSFGAFSKLSGEMFHTGRDRRAAPLVLRAANTWLAARKTEPTFVFIHLFDVHKPWSSGSYDAQIKAVDKLLSALRNEPWWDRSLVILTSDHGEGLGEHGESDHGYFLYQSTLHVPLTIHWPQGAAGMPARMSAQVDQPVGLIDVAPTILDFLKLPVPPQFRGKSFLDQSPRPVISESVYARDSFGWAALRSIRVGNWKYIDAPKPELYDLAKDPKELTNLIKANPAQAASLKAQLPRPPDFIHTLSGDPQRRQEVLKSLGYLAPGPRGQSKTPPADPKDRLPLLLRYEDAVNLIAARRYDAAITTLRAILATDPGNLLARRDLGVALAEKGDYAKALTELQQVAAAAPDDYVTRFQLGLACERTGRLTEAIDQFEIATRLAPEALPAKQALQRIRAKQ